MSPPPHRHTRLAAAAAGGVLLALIGASPALADSIRERQWHLDALQVTAAHKITQGAGVTVAVIDTGVRADHRDLAGNILPGIDFRSAGTKGWVDTDGHGTSMAGLIAGHGHGGGHADGVMGIAPKAKVLPIRALNDDDLPSEKVPDAIVAAVRQHADVISMSFTATPNDHLRSAIQQAIDADIVLVAGAGNRPGDVFLQYPAKYPGVVAVGATGRDGKVAPITVTGPEMAMVAPGVDIVSTGNTGEYRKANGTSDATAIVAGAAALIRAEYPDLSAAEVVHRLTATATDKGAPGRDNDYGYGALNLTAALTADVPATTGQPSTAASDPAASVGEPPSEADRQAAPSTTTTASTNWVAISTVVAVLIAVILLIVGLPTWLIIRNRKTRRS
ncbi:S8 family serine peptidase [Actinoplanes sp. NPDC049681]|uniref:S8 family serine peptidase n=1 Tax=Actinoplanes sp. NPDC049681 TaxID=3363905 RepID=UPI0037B2C1D9